MFDIQGSTIKVTRTDEMAFDIELIEGKFRADDVIRFAVYKAGGLNLNPILEKTINVQQDTDTITIELTGQDTTIGKPTNHELTYWYQVDINDKQTILGFENKTAPEFIIMPKGGNIDV